MEVINNIISLLLTLAIVFFAPLMVAYAGFLYVVNSVNPSGINKAKDVLVHTVVGIVIALAAWMIVDAVMAALYNPEATAPGLYGGKLDTWSKLIKGDSVHRCVEQLGVGATSLNQAAGSGSGTGGNVEAGVTGIQQLAAQSGDCTQSALQADGIDASISAKMSCIAMKESTCYLTAKNPASSASGLFQVVFGYNDTGHNLNFPSCTQAAIAAHYSVSGDLNCSTSVLSGGRPNQNKVALYNACRAAASNAKCNAQAAQWLYTNKGGYNNWPATAPQCP
jgi:hypothetical protein